MEEITVTKAQLACALRTWENEARALGFAERTDAKRFIDTADYLFGLIRKEQGQ